ncbi:MAG: CHAD domain-containing protein [Acidimicrobiia bacterium]|nr:CHAD domain-containing protein [Acidimicrobiia bacterium]NNF09882.1 CHAD domain-containing protein [Acidimicrobiia bacterium]NNL70509.1 CHAD domain-containing protein [Acidimicrobiia bacterium]
MTTRPAPRSPSDHPDIETPPFRLGGGEFLGAGLQRVALEEIDYAIAALRSFRLDIGVHESRKAFRRVRAALRLVRDPLGYGVYRAENVALRDLGRLIGGSRDATVMVETVVGLSYLYGDVLQPGAFDTLRSNLLERDKLIRRRVTGDRIESVVTGLEAARDRFAAWDRHLLDDGFESVAGGLHRVYRRGRRRMADAYREPSSEAFHVWRKRVRYLRFQMALLEGMWPELQRGIATDLEYLADALGAEHDLAELHRLLDTEPEMLPSDTARQVLQGILVGNQARLRRACEPVGARLYSEAPNDFVRRLGGYWEVWRPA